MGQKVNPISFRLPHHGQTTYWHCNTHFSYWLHQDIALRRFFEDFGKVFIYRKANSILVVVYLEDTQYQKQMLNVDKYNLQLSKFTNCTTNVVFKPIDTKKGLQLSDAKLLANVLARLLENRKSPYYIKFILKELYDQDHKKGIKGLRIEMSGRFGGIAMARKHKFQFGSVPLHTIRAHIDYSTSVAYTVYGIFGIKLWIHHAT